ncbi:MAG: hypothetical protein E6H96_09785 [Chloroflexi bacterium]|nr:MAG: hypothetical protein E6H96_09785 [Chloroflexota bacterium]
MSNFLDETTELLRRTPEVATLLVGLPESWTQTPEVAQVFADVGPWKAYLGTLLRREDPAAVAG